MGSHSATSTSPPASPAVASFQFTCLNSRVHPGRRSPSAFQPRCSKPRPTLVDIATRSTESSAAEASQLSTIFIGHALFRTSKIDAMSERTEIIELVDSIFDTVDAKDWGAAERLFEPTVDVDFTSLTGGEPATITNVQLVDGWRQGLHSKKKSFHLVGHHRVRVHGDTATVALKGYAYNVLDEDLGSGMWEVWGSYDIPLRRTDAGWRAAGLAFHAWHSRGDASVRTHVLPS
jgi:hypothetical protein